ncbi:alpha/beta hydrolase [Flavivirga algicola]|uniref:Alpha/beta hydrolase n=1 Tax=Flavivirga algicola TaxID=2729136 RepID=A0ABX1S3G3_9FLAO|nr:alpha/beta hydrolase [Flavivirga algicola]NMH89753.1 alpha/beta hydrolase [Flavivirga algicola]
MLNTHRKKVRLRLRKAGVVLISLYVMIGALLYFLQEKMLFHPTVLPQDFKFEFSYPFEELYLETEENTIVNAIHFKAENPKGVILYFHGNAGDLSRWGLITEFFVKKQYDVLVMDYRTFGKSTGKLSEKALYKDAEYCYNYLKQYYSENDIIIYGRSLGTGIATYVASRNRPKQLILETPYHSMTDIAKSRFPVFPVKYILKYKLPSYQFITKVGCPISILHGTNDQVVPYKSGRSLYEAAPASLTTFITVEGGTHNDLIHHEAFLKSMNQIL